MSTIIDILIVILLILIVCGFIYYVFLRPRRGWYDTIPTPVISTPISSSSTSNSTPVIPTPISSSSTSNSTPVIPTPISSSSTSNSTPVIIHGGDPTQSEDPPDYTTYINNVAQSIYDIRTACEDIIYDLHNLIVLPTQPTDDTVANFLIIFMWAVDHAITIFHDGIANGSFVVNNNIIGTCSGVFKSIRKYIDFQVVQHYILSMCQRDDNSLNAYCAAITEFSGFMCKLASEGYDTEARLVMSIVVEHFRNIVTEMIRLVENDIPISDEKTMNMFLSVIQSNINMLHNLSINMLTSKFAIAIIYRFITHFINSRSPNVIHTLLLDDQCLIYRLVFDIPLDVDFNTINPLGIRLAESLTTLYHTGNEGYLSNPHVIPIAINIPGYLYSQQFSSDNTVSVIAIIIVYEIICDFKITDYVPTDEAYIIFFNNIVDIVVSAGMLEEADASVVSAETHEEADASVVSARMHKEAEASAFVRNCIAELSKLRGVNLSASEESEEHIVEGGDMTYRSSYLSAYNVHHASKNDSMTYIRKMLITWSLNTPFTNQRLFRLNSVYDPFGKIADFVNNEVYGEFIEHIATNCGGVIPNELIGMMTDNVPCHGNKFPNERFFSVAMMHMMNFLVGRVNYAHGQPMVRLSSLLLTDMSPTRNAKYEVGEQVVKMIPYFVNIPYFLCKSTDKHTVTVDSQAGFSRYRFNMTKYADSIRRISEKANMQLYSCDFGADHRLNPLANPLDAFTTLMETVSSDELSNVIGRWNEEVRSGYTPNDIEIRIAALYPYISAVFPHILHAYAYVWMKESSRGISVADKATNTLKRVGEFVQMDFFPVACMDSRPFTALLNIALGDMIMITAWGASIFQQVRSPAREDGDGVYDIVLGASVDDDTLTKMRTYMYDTAKYVLKHLGDRVDLNVNYPYTDFRILPPDSYHLDDLTPKANVATYGYCGVFPKTYGSMQLRNVTSWWAHYDPWTNRDMRPGVLFLAGAMQLLLNEFLIMWIDSKTSQNKYYTSIANSGDNGRLVLMRLPGSDDVQLSMMVFDYGECDEHHLCKDLMNMLDHHLRLIAREMIIVALETFGNRNVAIQMANLMMMCFRTTLLKRTDSVNDDDASLFKWKQVIDEGGNKTDNIELDMRNVNMSAMQFLLHILRDNSVLKYYWNGCAGVVIDSISDRFAGVRAPRSGNENEITVSEYIEIIGGALVAKKNALLPNIASPAVRLILENVDDNRILEYAKNVIIGSFIPETDMSNSVIRHTFFRGRSFYDSFMNEHICIGLGAIDYIRDNAIFTLSKSDNGNVFKMESKVLIPISLCGQVDLVAEHL